MSGHTPTPWEVTERHEYYEIVGPRANSSWYGRKGAWAVAYADTDWEPSEQLANAAFIVLACNSHGELLACMIDLFENPQFQVAVGGNPNMVDALMDRARAAISTAKGEAL